MRIHPLGLITTILNRLSTKVEVEAKAKVEEDKEVAKAKTFTKASSKIVERIMIKMEAHMKEEIFEEGGVKEDLKIAKGVMVAIGIVADQTTLQGIAQHQIKAKDDKKTTMHLPIIRMIQRDYLLCSICLIL